ncbi:MAG: hypothetical protein HYZ89_04045 [Candidatus Omnitrophica bacterium]|nr:hypothetical protein [Candidatus Omnitrophota bacterium]
MPASYPSAIKTFTTLVDGVDDVLASHQNDPNAEITAIETELGTNPRGTAADVKTRLDAAHNSDGTLKTNSVPTAAIVDANVTEAKLAASAVAQAKLKTATSTGSSAASGPGVLQTMSGGDYSFYPQTKSSIAGSQNAHFKIMGMSGSPVSPSTSFTTNIFIQADSGQTLSWQNRYVTASGIDVWMFVAIDKTTGDVICAWQSMDHPAYGSGGDFNAIPHPFRMIGGFSPSGIEVILVRKAVAEQLVADAKQQGKHVLDMIHDTMKPDLSGVVPYEPLHSGRFIGKDPELVSVLPASVVVRELTTMNVTEQQARLDRIVQRVAANKARKDALTSRLKGKLGLSDTEMDELKELIKS